jgi:ribosomal protein L12E/L44/L45/RPP1/RPP2
MFAWLKYLNLVPVLVAVVSGIVNFIEHLHDGSFDKKGKALELFDSAWPSIAAGFGITAPVESIRGIVSAIIEIAVAGFNLVGIFTHKDAAAVAAAPAPAAAAAAPAPAAAMAAPEVPSASSAEGSSMSPIFDAQAGMQGA